MALHRFTPAELQRQLEAERRGGPFLVHRDGAGELRIVALADRERLSVGRGEQADVRLDGDPEASRLHAELERLGDDWTVADDGLSRNGSYVNGERVTGRRRLRDGDELRFGRTWVRFRAPAAARAPSTVVAPDRPAAALTDVQRRVLVALCRPYAAGSPYAVPATNQQIAAELHLSVDAVKAHLRALFAKLAVGDLPQNRKRVALVERALETGVVAPRELEPPAATEPS